MKKVIEEKNGAMLTREKVEDLSKKVDDLQKNIPSENNSSLCDELLKCDGTTNGTMDSLETFYWYFMQ